MEEPQSPGTPLIWVLKDERPGTGNQALGIADALVMPYEVKSLEYGPLGRLPNLLLGASLRCLTLATRAGIVPPWPDVVISAGRRGASVARYIKKASGGECFVCHLMYPGRGPAAAVDLVAVPAHDQITGANILTVTGAPHRISDASLEEARQIWSSAWNVRIPTMKPPILGVLVGGGSEAMPFGPPEASELAGQVTAWQTSTGGSILITTSRRTGDAAHSLRNELTAGGITPDLFHTWQSEGENPYVGILALSDTLIVTGDSVSMLSEACAAPGNVYFYRSPNFASAKHDRFLESLIAAGAARPSHEMALGWTSQPLNSSIEIAAVLKSRLGWDRKADSA